MPRRASAAEAMRLIESLATEIGPRRPTSAAERRAAQVLRDDLATAGLDPRLESFDAYSTFGAPLGVLLALALLPSLVPRRRRVLRGSIAAAATALAALEGGLVNTPLSDLLSRRPSANLVAEIPPAGDERRTLCLVSHMDTSRSGLMFHPALLPYLHPALIAVSGAVALQGAEAALSPLRAGRALLRVARLAVAAGLAILVEREARGQDVPGANDNASGAAVATLLMAERASEPLESTRLVLLVTGAEEAGMLGAQAFARAHDARDWVFLNFDGVGAPAPLCALGREGYARKWDADPGLLALAQRISGERPELGLTVSDRNAGLTYDATVFTARGGRALTLIAQGRTIPNYHWPGDVPENLDPDVLARAIETGREMIAAIDRGEVDRG